MGPNLLSDGIAFLVLLTYAFMPYLTPKTLAFGVRIPEERQPDPFLQQVRRDYFIGLFVVLLMTIGINHYTHSLIKNFRFLITFGVLFVLLMGNYEIAHTRVERRKQHEQWYQGYPEAMMAIIEPEDVKTLRKPFTLWLIVNAFFVFLLAVMTIGVYPHLPKTLPSHWSSQGFVENRVSKTWWTVSQPLLALVVVLVGISLFEIYLLTHLRPDIDPHNPQASRMQYFLFVRRMLHALGIVQFGIVLSFGLTDFSMWGWIKHPSSIIWTGPALLAVLAVMAITFVTGQEGSRLAVTPQDITPYRHRNDDAQWKAGLWYYNPSDPKWLVTKRFGVGWTLNFAHPISWLMIGVILALVIVSIAFHH